MIDEHLKTISAQYCLDIYMHYHVSQTKALPEVIKKAWSSGQEIWLCNQATERLDRQQGIARAAKQPMQFHSFD